MKKLLFMATLFAGLCSQGFAQEKFGRTLNIGVSGGSYYGYYGNTAHLSFNYEIDVARNFTLAPFVSFYSYSDRYYWGNKNYPYRYYNYRKTVIPIGLKGTYYFDELLKANSHWDFYLAASAGFALVKQSWDNDYYGDRDYFHEANPFLVDIHLGAEYHFNSRIGAFLDLSSSVQSLGLAIHTAGQPVSRKE